MEINVEKTKLVTFSTLTPLNVYTINSTAIEKSAKFQIPGRLFNYRSNLAYIHRMHITKKAFKKLGLIRHRVYPANSETKLHVYTSLIRSFNMHDNMTPKYCYFTEPHRFSTE